jgi:hypothetical protein
MFKTAPASEPAPVDVTPADALIPISVLSLDVDVPAGGWVAYLKGRGIQVSLDHIGRPSISSADARQLLDERREDELRRQEVARRQEQQFIEADQRFRAQLNPGTPWWQFPDGASPAEVWAQAEHDAQPKRESVLQHALSNSGEVEYHSLAPAADEW